MSHSAVARFSICVEAELSQLNVINDKIEFFKKQEATSSVLQEQLLLLQDKLEDSRNQLHEISKEKTTTGSVEAAIRTYTREKDSVLKRMANLEANIDYAGDILIKNEEITKAINEIILDNGVLATYAMKEMAKRGVNLTVENLNKMIDEVRTDLADKNEVLNIQNSIKNQLNQMTELPREFKLQLFNELSNYKTPQELMDAAAYIKTIEFDAKGTTRLIENYVGSLKEMGFKLVGQKNKVLVDQENIIKTAFYNILEFRNAKNQKFTATFNIDGEVSYDMGNYQGHLCFKDSEKLEEKLKQKNYHYKEFKITRNVSNAKPQSMAMKTTENKK